MREKANMCIMSYRRAEGAKGGTGVEWEAYWDQNVWEIGSKSADVTRGNSFL